MAELVADARANPYVQWRADLVPGQRNADDIISTPDGTAMELLFDEIDPDAARSEVEAGALVVWSGCGCGDTDCGELEWPDVDDLGDAEPRFDWAVCGRRAHDGWSSRTGRCTGDAPSAEACWLRRDSHTGPARAAAGALASEHVRDHD